MLKFFRKAPKEVVAVRGRICRIGRLASMESTSRYALTLVDDGTTYIVYLNAPPLVDGLDTVLALTKPGDEVSFQVLKGYLNIVAESFVNYAFAKNQVVTLERTEGDV